MTRRSSIPRRGAALLMLVLLGAPIALTFAGSGGAACPMCSGSCCCRPSGANGACRLGRACATPEREAAAAEAVPRMILAAAATLDRPELPVDFVEPRPVLRALQRSMVPPVPPPRLRPA